MSASSDSAVLDRRIEIGALVAIALWAAVAWAFLRPSSIATDWQGIRQTDTQAIARHFTEPGANLFYPRIDWGGVGPGYVETELPLYSYLTARIMRVTGDAEWPGQLISLLATVATAFVLFRGLSRRLGAAAAAFGLGIFLVAPIVLFTGTSVQPDAFSLCGYVIAWFAWLRYQETGELRPLVTYGVAGGLAMMVKPTMAQLGISSFLYLLLVSPLQLKRVPIWVTWLLMVLVLALYLKHALALYQTYGNSFGVLSGNDAKTPKLEHLLMPKLFFKAGRISLLWGTGILGALALGLALLRPRGHAATVALLAGNAVWVVFTLRYSSDYAGTHYALCEAVMAAQAGAQVAANFGAAARRPFVIAGVIVLAIVFERTALFRVRKPYEDPTALVSAATATALAQHAKPGELVIVRAKNPKYDDFWRTNNNVSDPRIFYLTKTRGWGIAADDDDPKHFEELRSAGARFYVRPFAGAESQALSLWLQQHARLLEATRFGGRIYAFSR